MPTIRIPNFPPETHRRLKELAAKNGRTVSQQAIVLLAEELGLPLSKRILNAQSKRQRKRENP